MRARAAALIVTVLLAVTGCTRTTEAPLLTAEDASDQMQALVRDTMDVAGGEWTSMSNGPSPDECPRPRGFTGVSFSWDQISEGAVDNPKAVMERVGRSWRDKGLPTWTQNVERADGKILHRVRSQDHIVRTIEFSATTSRMIITVESMCGSGNVDDYYNDIE